MINDVAFGQYYPVKSPVHRMDPRMKIVLLITYIVMIFVVKNFWGFLLAAGFLLVAIFLSTAISYNAHSVLLTHNHPGGTCAPSPEDIASTIQLQRLLNGVGILVLDHIIVAQGRTYSMIQHGDIDYRQKR